MTLRSPTEREQQSLANAMLHGRKEAAKRMGITLSTLRNHLTSLNNKLEVGNMREAAIALGWLDIPPKYVVAFGPAPTLPERHHELAEQLLNYADGVLQQLEKARLDAPPKGRETTLGGRSVAGPCVGPRP